MENSNLENTVPSNLEEESLDKTINTDVDSKDGQNKCPKCGATDISYNIKTGKLRCNFCRYEFSSDKVDGLEEDLSKLEGRVVTSGASKIDKEFNDIITLKCDSCGAEVVIDTASASQARCHWCRNYLSKNKQIPNGSIPDVVLPFKITKEEAQKEIEAFVGKRKFYANPRFRKEFTTENIMGVYFPYMLVDANCHAKLSGQGEHLTRTYTVGNDEHRETRYDADLYDVEREFDLVIDDLSIESSKDKLSRTSEKTNNIINSIMPFDTENCVKFDANYIKGYNSEKRDTDVDEIHSLMETQCKDIAKFAVNNTLKNYDRGVRWDNQDVNIKGEQWEAAYLPVWLYSYQEVSGSKKLLHYVAVNARTKETMGSVPIHMPKLLFVSFIIEIFSFFMYVSLDDFEYNWLFLTLGALYFFIMYAKYRNSGARHKYETETKREVSNLIEKDQFVRHETGLENHRIRGCNNTSVSGSTFNDTAMDLLKGNGKVTTVLEIARKVNKK